MGLSWGWGSPRPILRTPDRQKPLLWGLSHESGVLAFGGGFGDDARMVNVRRVERDQLLLMPPSLSDWLPADHLAWFVVDVVAELDMSGFYRSLRPDGRGGASYDPEVMLGVLLYAYCVGERSSRRIEQRLSDDVAFRVVAANQAPDHATLARFRRRHQDAIAGVFSQVVALCISRGPGASRVWSRSMGRRSKPTCRPRRR